MMGSTSYDCTVEDSLLPRSGEEKKVLGANVFQVRGTSVVIIKIVCFQVMSIFLKTNQNRLDTTVKNNLKKCSLIHQFSVFSPN